MLRVFEFEIILCSGLDLICNNCYQSQTSPSRNSIREIRSLFVIAPKVQLSTSEPLAENLYNLMELY